MEISIEEIKEEIKKFISNNFPIPKEKILNNPRLVDDLGLNDVDCVFIFCYLEEKYDIGMDLTMEVDKRDSYTIESLAEHVVEEVEAYHS
ncbi:MAG: hypothetical protein WC499_01470 [Patescibacteria group bacterium]